MIISSNYKLKPVAGVLASVCGILSFMSTSSYASFGSGAIEEVVVTALRREQSLQDVPASVSALSADQLKAFKIERTTDLADQIPNVQIEEQFGLTGPRIAVRGIVNADFNAVSNTPVTVYSDDVVLNSIQDHGFAMFDVERVELLRGPQGTFFGRNSATGAIQFFSVKPTEDTTGFINLTFAEFDQKRFEGAVSGTLIEDMLFGRISLLKNDGDGHIKNDFDGKDGPEADDFSIRTFLTYEKDKLDAALKVQYSEGEGQAITFHNILPINIFDGLSNAGPGSDYQKIQLDRAERTESIESTLTSLVVNYDFEGLVLTSVTGYSEHDFFNFNDDDSTSSQFFDEYFANEQEQFSQEFRLTTTDDSDLQWIAGVYYLTEEVSSQTNFEFSGFFGDPSVAGFGSDISVNQDLDSYAIFGQADYSISDEWSVSIGLRWSRDEKDIDHSVVPCFEFDPTISTFIQPGMRTGDCGDPAAIGATPSQSESWSASTGKVLVEYTPNADVLYYASIARGFKGGGFNGGAERLEQFSTVDPEIVISYEAGAKLTLMDGRAIVNIGAFYYDYEDMQQFTIGFAPGSQTLARSLVNVPEARNMGFEIEAFLRPIDGMTLNLGLGYVDTEFTDFPGLDDFGNPISFDGNEFPGAPKITFNGLLQYEISTSFGFIIPQVDFSYIDEYFADIDNTGSISFAPGDTGFAQVDGRTFDTTLGDFWDVNLRLSFTNEEQTTKLTLFVENIEDEVQWTNHFDPSAFGVGSTISTLRKPRTVGITLSHEF